MMHAVDKRFLTEVEKQFDITRMVGSGAFGELYEAYDIAIKRLLPFHSFDAYKKERSFISSLNGKSNIIQLVHTSPPLAPNGIILVEEQQALIFEYFEHDSPSDYVKDLTIEEIADYMKNLFLALSYLHALGIIHRDVKLNNFLYDRRKKKYLLVDFGLAEKKMQTTALGISKGQSPSSDRSIGTTSGSMSKSFPATKSNGNILPCEVFTGQLSLLAESKGAGGARHGAADDKEADVGRQKDERIGDREELRGQIGTSSQPRGNSGIPRARSADGQSVPDHSSGRVERWGQNVYPTLPHDTLPVVPA